MDEGADMHSLLMTDTNTLIMGGLHNYIVEFDLNTVQETQKVIPSALWTLLIHRFPAYFESNIVSVCVCVCVCSHVCFHWQVTVEMPGVAIMRQSSRFFFCGHTSGKVGVD